MIRWIVILALILAGGNCLDAQSSADHTAEDYRSKPKKPALPPKLPEIRTMKFGIVDDTKTTGAKGPEIVEAGQNDTGNVNLNGGGSNSPRTEGATVIRSDGVQIRNDRGVRRIKMFEDERNKLIYVEVTETYKPADHNRLIRKHPQLDDYLSLFPRQIG
ncbi:MAG: hypothetical protein AAGA30_21905, partial [Planctomycetota bacterium]